MKFKKILTIGVSESTFDAVYWKKIDALAEKRVSLSPDSPELKAQLADTDCLIVNPFVFKVDRECIDSAPQLKYITAISTAYAKVDCTYAAERDIVVSNIPGYSTEAVAEFVFAVILDHARQLEEGKKRARKGKYSEEGISAVEIKNKVFGILGLGRIGARTAEIALGFGAEVRYWSRTRKEEFEAKGITYKDADSLIPKCDFLSLHFAQAKETKNFLNEERIQKLKNGCIVVNTSPMELVDIDALERRLKTGDITFILDHSDEMTKEDLQKLSKHKNCIIYPPVAYVTQEARVAKQDILVKNIESFLKGNPTNRVN